MNKNTLSKPIIGIVGPFTGPRSCYGDLLKNEILSTNLDEYTNIVWGDDQANPIHSAEIARFLSKKDPLAVIGHFNSASAEIGAKIYSPLNIPLILPAATAPHLTMIPLTFRLCPTDIHQITSMLQFIAAMNVKRVSIWTDGSPYSLSLNKLFHETNTVELIDIEKSKENDLIIFFGAHYHVANELLKFKNKFPNLSALCCDDCSVEEFNQLVKGLKNIWVATPNPNFPTTIKLAAELIISYLKESKRTMTFSNWLTITNGAFIKQQYSASSFDILSTQNNC